MVGRRERIATRLMKVGEEEKYKNHKERRRAQRKKRIKVKEKGVS
jgi:hypothetical protein